MKIIVDSGATKSKWKLIDSSVEYKTFGGLHPMFHSEESFLSIITFLPSPEQVINIDFFGAGCKAEKEILFVKNCLKKVFVNAEISVKSDIDIVVNAFGEKKNAFYGILGTGANVVFFDGIQIEKITPSLGFILGDEASGADFGKQLLSDYFYKRMPIELCLIFENQFDISLDKIIQSVYKEAFPNRFLAQFAVFLSENRNHEYIEDLLRKRFTIFVETQLNSSISNEVYLSGSIAFHFKDVLEKVLSEKGFVLKGVYACPLER